MEISKLDLDMHFWVIAYMQVRREMPGQFENVEVLGSHGMVLTFQSCKSNIVSHCLNR